MLEEWRELTKLVNTYLGPLPTLLSEDGRLHTHFNQAVAATGRLSTSNPNLQAIPIRTELGREIRSAFVAEPGHRLVSADYSQVELRILAHVSGEPKLREAFARGDDIHTATAAEVLGKDPAKPDVVVATNGGSDLIYLPNNDRKLAGRIVKALLEQDYVSGLFVRDDLGRFPGALPMSALSLEGKAVTPHPAIVVNFRSWSSCCEEPTNCSVEIADTVLRQGQGMHGSFSRGDTMNFMAAIGPDFKTGYIDDLPVSNADVGATAARLLGLIAKPKGTLLGRVITEAMPNGATPKASAGSVSSQASAKGLKTVLKFQSVGSQRYFDAAGFPGRTLGLDPQSGKQKTAGK